MWTLLVLRRLLIKSESAFHFDQLPGWHKYRACSTLILSSFALLLTHVRVWEISLSVGKSFRDATASAQHAVFWTCMQTCRAEPKGRGLYRKIAACCGHLFREQVSAPSEQVVSVLLTMRGYASKQASQPASKQASRREENEPVYDAFKNA